MEPACNASTVGPARSLRTAGSIWNSVRWRNIEGTRSLQGTVEFIRDKRQRWRAFIKEIGIEPHRVRMICMNRVARNKCNCAAAAVTATVLAMALAAGAAQAQQLPRRGLASAVPAPPVSIPLAPPLTLIRSHPVYIHSAPYFSTAAPGSAPTARGPYLIGPGQWVPAGQQADAMAMQWEPGDTMATPAAPSGHWDWKRASLAELVELSRRNKASRAAD